MIIITAKRDGFRRCGMAHAARPVEHQDDAFSPAQLAQLQAEPMLVVELVAEVPQNPGPLDTVKTEPAVEPDAAEAATPATEDHLVEAIEAKPAPKRNAKKAGKE